MNPNIVIGSNEGALDFSAKKLFAEKERMMTARMSPKQAAVKVDTLSGLAPIRREKIVTITIMTVIMRPVIVAVISDVDMSRRHSDSLKAQWRTMLTNIAIKAARNPTTMACACIKAMFPIRTLT